MRLLSCEGLALGYEGRKIAENISFSLEQGQYLCVVGDNGAGKSTLMKTILGLQAPLAGSVVRGPGLRDGAIGYLPQQSQAQQDFPASVWEIALSGCLHSLGRKPFYGKEHKERARQALERLGVWEFRAKCCRELSGGQRQRVLLARALCASDTLLMLDEPASGLDPQMTEEFYRLIEGLVREGMTVMMISHDLRASLRYSSHILHVARTPLFFGTAADYRESPAGKLYAMQEAAL